MRHSHLFYFKYIPRRLLWPYKIIIDPPRCLTANILFCRWIKKARAVRFSASGAWVGIVQIRCSKGWRSSRPFPCLCHCKICVQGTSWPWVTIEKPHLCHFNIPTSAKAQNQSQAALSPLTRSSLKKVQLEKQNNFRLYLWSCLVWYYECLIHTVDTFKIGRNYKVINRRTIWATTLQALKITYIKFCCTPLLCRCVCILMLMSFLF